MRETISALLLAWYDQNARTLPWRGIHDPYRTWVSETMLQQTRVETVRGYYERFLSRFPDVAALAAADEADVLKLWEGLGYYSRARLLQKAARAIVSQYGGELPAERAAVLLPQRADTVALYRRIRTGQVVAGDLQPVFAAEGARNTGKMLASLTALQELGLVEERDGRWLPVAVTAKQDLASAPVLQKLAGMAKQE